jgi:carbonic anhydrase
MILLGGPGPGDPGWGRPAGVPTLTMSVSTAELVQRNAAFAATGVFAGLPFPSGALQVLGCVDSRVDPRDVLGLTLGEGVVMRNIGGRVTPAALRQWALLARLGRLTQDRLTQDGPAGGAHLVILHHTDCGITRLTDHPEQLAAFFEIPAAELDGKAVTDPYAAVRVDTAIARQSLPPGRLVSGLVYDVATGLIEIADPAAVADPAPAA